MRRLGRIEPEQRVRDAGERLRLRRGIGCWQQDRDILDAEIAELAGASRPKVNLWRSRYEDKGIGGLAAEKRSGRPRTIDHAEIVTATLMPPPKSISVFTFGSSLNL